jgi:hypothetical protein
MTFMGSSKDLRFKAPKPLFLKRGDYYFYKYRFIDAVIPLKASVYLLTKAAVIHIFQLSPVNHLFRVCVCTCIYIYTYTDSSGAWLGTVIRVISHRVSIAGLLILIRVLLTNKSTAKSTPQYHPPLQEL